MGLVWCVCWVEEGWEVRHTIFLVEAEEVEMPVSAGGLVDGIPVCDAAEEGPRVFG